jgi:hypothetical protein
MTGQPNSCKNAEAPKRAAAGTRLQRARVAASAAAKAPELCKQGLPVSPKKSRKSKIQFYSRAPVSSSGCELARPATGDGRAQLPRAATPSRAPSLRNRGHAGGAADFRPVLVQEGCYVQPDVPGLFQTPSASHTPQLRSAGASLLSLGGWLHTGRPLSCESSGRCVPVTTVCGRRARATWKCDWSHSSAVQSAAEPTLRRSSNWSIAIWR